MGIDLFLIGARPFLKYQYRLFPPSTRAKTHGDHTKVDLCANLQRVLSCILLYLSPVTPKHHFDHRSIVANFSR